MSEHSPNFFPALSDLLILKAVLPSGPACYECFCVSEQITNGAALAEQGALIPCAEAAWSRGLLESEWALSDNNRPAPKCLYSSLSPGEKIPRGNRSWTAWGCDRRRVKTPSRRRINMFPKLRSLWHTFEPFSIRGAIWTTRCDSILKLEWHDLPLRLSRESPPPRQIEFGCTELIRSASRNTPRELVR